MKKLKILKSGGEAPLEQWGFELFDGDELLQEGFLDRMGFLAADPTGPIFQIPFGGSPPEDPPQYLRNYFSARSKKLIVEEEDCHPDHPIVLAGDPRTADALPQYFDARLENAYVFTGPTEKWSSKIPSAAWCGGPPRDDLQVHRFPRDLIIQAPIIKFTHPVLVEGQILGKIIFAPAIFCRTLRAVAVAARGIFTCGQNQGFAKVSANKIIVGRSGIFADRVCSTNGTIVQGDLHARLIDSLAEVEVKGNLRGFRVVGETIRAGTITANQVIDRTVVRRRKFEEELARLAREEAEFNAAYIA